MLDVNPHITVEAFNEQLTSENALRILDGYDVVIYRRLESFYLLAMFRGPLGCVYLRMFG